MEMCFCFFNLWSSTKQHKQKEGNNRGSRGSKKSRRREEEKKKRRRKEEKKRRRKKREEEIKIDDDDEERSHFFLRSCIISCIIPLFIIIFTTTTTGWHLKMGNRSEICPSIQRGKEKLAEKLCLFVARESKRLCVCFFFSSGGFSFFLRLYIYFLTTGFFREFLLWRQPRSAFRTFTTMSWATTITDMATP